MHHFGGLLVILAVVLAGFAMSASTGQHLLLGLVIGFAFFCLAVLIGEYVSADARASRALQAGRVGESLEQYVPGKTSEEMARFLADALPGWDEAQRSLQSAVAELTDLQRAIAAARFGSAGQALGDQIVRESHVAAAALWRSADRLAAVAAHRDDSETLRLSIEKELASLDRIETALHTARIGLAELALADYRDGRSTQAIETAVIRLVALGKAASEIADLERGDSRDC